MVREIKSAEKEFYNDATSSFPFSTLSFSSLVGSRFGRFCSRPKRRRARGGRWSKSTTFKSGGAKFTMPRSHVQRLGVRGGWGGPWKRSTNFKNGGASFTCAFQ